MKLDPRIVFYLKHQKQIDEWHGIRSDLHAAAFQFYSSLVDRLDEAITRLEGNPQLFPKLDKSPPVILISRDFWADKAKRKRPIAAVGFEWPKQTATFQNSCIGIRLEKDHELYPQLWEKICSQLRRSGIAEQHKRTEQWPAWKYVPVLEGDYWNDLDLLGENVIAQILESWRVFEPIISKAFHGLEI